MKRRRSPFDCRGECCEYFYVSHSKKRLLDKNCLVKKPERNRLLAILRWKGKEVGNGQHASCSMFDRKTGLCRQYAKRPGMCRLYKCEACDFIVRMAKPKQEEEK